MFISRNWLHIFWTDQNLAYRRWRVEERYAIALKMHCKERKTRTPHHNASVMSLRSNHTPSVLLRKPQNLTYLLERNVC